MELIAPILPLDIPIFLIALSTKTSGVGKSYAGGIVYITGFL